MTKIYVYRCTDGCDEIAASSIRSKMIEAKRDHRREFDHAGIIRLEDKEVLENE